MVASVASTVVDRPGKTSFWTPSRPAGRYRVSEPGASSTQPPSVGGGTLDNVRAAFWQAYRHLFPPHALAVQTPSGSLVISWSIMDEPGARYPYAAPVMLRFDEALLEVMGRADPQQRLRLAQKHEPQLREGLRGYDPFSQFPNARVVNIG